MINNTKFYLGYLISIIKFFDLYPKSYIILESLDYIVIEKAQLKICLNN